ncbi:MAG: hypothetical protein ACTHNS_10395 [Marmoricola sp.]
MAVALAPRATDQHAATTVIERSEDALAALLSYDERLHGSNIQHDPLSCLVCFAAR